MKRLRDELARRVLAVPSRIPTSTFGRLTRTARAAVGTAWNARSDDLDADTLTKMITSIGKLKGIPMKMGQIMSYIDVALPKEVREALSVLQTKKELLKLALPGVFLFRIRFGLWAVLARLGARANWRQLELDAAQSAWD